jgi:hypothetical protein
MGFATDVTIHRVFKNDARLEHALREEFLDHVRGYARYQQCKPCPIRYWRADSNICELQSPGRDTGGDPALHFVDRLLLYAAAMEPCEQGKAHPVALVLSELCNTLDISFVMAASAIFIAYSESAEDFLRNIRVKP